MMSQTLSPSREKTAERSPGAYKAGFKEMVIRNWYLGFTAFGGPAVHFQIVWLFVPLALFSLFGAANICPARAGLRLTAEMLG